MKKKALLLLAGFLLASCAGEEKNLASVNEGEEGMVIEESLEGIDLAEMGEIFGYPLQTGTSSPQLFPLASSGADPRILMRIYHHRIRKMHDVLKVIESPIYIAHHLYFLYREGQLSCASFSPPEGCGLQQGGECTVQVSINPEGCSTVVFLNSWPITITITGSFSLSFKYAGGGIEVNVRTEDLKVEGESGRFITFSGEVTKTFLPEENGHSSELLVNLNIYDSSGSSGTARITKTVEVVYGISFSSRTTGHITFTPSGGETVEFDVDLKREVINENVNVKRIKMEDRILRDGVERKRMVDLKIERILNEGEVLKEITLSGTIELTGPDGLIEVELDSVIFDINCTKSPRGGSITISGKGRTITVIFRDDCSCKATLKEGDSEKEIDLCEVKNI